jgi:nucleotide-binding universal stress UspA family protein
LNRETWKEKPVDIQYNKVIVTLDGSELAECVLPHVEIVSHSCRVGGFELVRVVNPIEPHVRSGVPISLDEEKDLNQENVKSAEAYLNYVKDKLEEKGITASIKVLSGPTAKTLVDYINEKGADLVIISTHGRSGPSRWLWGSIADRLLHGTCTPVLMVRAPGCVPGV